MLGVLVLAQLSPAFAVRNYPPYSNCAFFNGGQGSLGGCDPGDGDLRAYSEANPSGASQVAVYMYSTTFSLNNGDTATLTNVETSNLELIMFLDSGDTSNVVNVAAYLADPGCSDEWECAYDGIVSGIFSKSQTSPATFMDDGPDTGPNRLYSISDTSSSYRVVAYVDAATAGTNDSYIDIRNAPYGVYEVSATEND